MKEDKEKREGDQTPFKGSKMEGKKIECVKCGKMFEEKPRIIGTKIHWKCLCYQLTFIMFPICVSGLCFMIFYYMNKNGVSVPANNTLNIIFMITLILFFVPFGIAFGPATNRINKKFDGIISRVENMIKKDGEK